MTHERSMQFIRAIEGKIDPARQDVAAKRTRMLAKLPLPWQGAIVRSASRKNPLMSFIVDPYAIFLSFPLVDEATAQALLPPGYRLLPSAMFTSTSPRPCAIVSAFTLRTGLFRGCRLELYVIAENRETGMLSWVIADCVTNAISFDPARGLSLPDAERDLFTTTFSGELLVDIGAKARGLALSASIPDGRREALSERLWIEGNLSVDYGGGLGKKESRAFSLVFDPREVETALRLPLPALRLDRIDLGRGMLGPEPFEVAVFPYAQHFLTSPAPTERVLRTREDLVKAHEEALAELERMADAGRRRS